MKKLLLIVLIFTACLNAEEKKLLIKGEQGGIYLNHKTVKRISQKSGELFILFNSTGSRQLSNLTLNKGKVLKLHLKDRVLR